MDVSKVLALGRQALADNKLDAAIRLLSGASRASPNVPEIWYYLATALGRKGGEAGSCCLCYLRTLQLLQSQPQHKLKQGHQLMAAAAADNCWLTAKSILPEAWPAAATDATLTAAVDAAAQHIVSKAMQAAAAAAVHVGSSSSSSMEQRSAAAEVEAPHVQLVVAGGLGIQAMQMAAAASNVQQQYVAAAAEQQQQQQQQQVVPSLGLSFIPSDSLTAHLAQQMFADNELDDIIEVQTWREFAQQQQQQQGISNATAAAASYTAALLAGCIQPNWSNAVAACIAACKGLCTSGSSSSNCVLSPVSIRVWAVPVCCQDLLNLNEVDLQEITNNTSGRYDYSAANAALRRSSRPCQVSRFKPQLLAEPVLAFELQLQDLLQQQQPEAAAAAAAVIGSGETAASTHIKIVRCGELHCGVWWLEFQMGPGDCAVSFAPTAAAAAAAAAGHGSSSSSSSKPDVLQPHVWQHIQYLPQQEQPQQQHVSLQNSSKRNPVYQGQQVTAGQELLLDLIVTADQISMSLYSSSSSSSDMAAAAAVQQQVASLTLQPQQQQQQQQQEAGRQILPYHLSMLNDHARTRAYDKGIAAAVQQLLQSQQQQQQGGPAVVLDVGCGTGLLSMMAATAAAAERTAAAADLLKIIACEREPVLASVAQHLINTNKMTQQITIRQKLSNQLSVAAATTHTQTNAKVKKSKTTGSSSSSSSSSKKNSSAATSSAAVDMPAKASLIVHEIFGTDPLSEHVLPALRHVQQHLAKKGAKFVPNAVRVVAAVASCDALHNHLRLPRQQQQQNADSAAAAAAAAASASSSSSSSVLWDVSSLLPLQPRKLELQLDELAHELQLLTYPTTVVTFDFEKQWTLDLNGQVTAELPKLQEQLSLHDWMQQQQQQQGSVPSSAGIEQQQQLCVISWFEADCGAGGWLSTAPGTTKYGHWQQSVEFVQAPVVAAAACADSSSSKRNIGCTAECLKLHVDWAVDRVKFALV